MTEDIVDKLREAACGYPYVKIHWPHYMLHQAADEIEKLRAEKAVLRQRLIVDDAMISRARNAHYAVSLSASGNGPMRAALHAALAPKDESK